MGLMQQAEAGQPKGPAFTPPDVAKSVAPQMKDAVDRIVAAGFKIMYAPDMKDELMAAVQSQEPTPKKLAENVAGLVVTLNQKTRGGLPVEAIFPAAVMLLTEAAGVLTAAGQDVSDDEYKDAVRMLFVMLGQKLGGTPEQITAAAATALPQGDPEEQGEPPQAPGEPDEAEPGAMQ